LVGYGKPPEASRFKPGHSGNPKGRPRRRRNLRTVLEEMLDQPISVREGERSRRLTKLEAFVLTLINNALKCDAKAVTSLLLMMRSLGMADDTQAPAYADPITDQDEALLADFFARREITSPSAADTDQTPPPELGPDRTP
jgi:hypothetical protein